jgi:hypothetical protein
MIRAVVAALLALVTLTVVSPASAAYSFRVSKMRMENTLARDASVRIAYEIHFENEPYAQAIDVVDIGLPHPHYDLRTMTASVDGHPLYRIRRSSYIDIGVEVQLGSEAIGPGRSATFRFEAVMPDMIYSDTTRDDLASFRITPTWFDPNLLVGTTDLQIAVFLPPGAPPEQVLSQNEPFTHKAVADGTTLVGWRFPATMAAGPRMVGVSFPRSSVDRVVVITRLELLARAFEASPFARVLLGIAAAVIFGIFFFRFSGRTGVSVFVFLVAVVGIVYGLYPRAQLWTSPGWLLVGLLLEWRLRRKRRVYLPPLVHVEGGGIKRGLTAPEAAVLLERPLGQVVTFVVFGLLKKGLVRSTSVQPLVVEVPPELRGEDERGARLAPLDRQKKRRRHAAQMGTVIHAYEHAFLDEIEAGAALAIEERDFTEATRGLITHVADRVMAFDVKATKEYYRRIVERAWTEARSIGDLESRTKKVDKDLEWMLLDPGWPGTFGEWDRAGYAYRPLWMRSGVTPAPVMRSGAPAAPVSTSGAPTFGDAAASFAGWTENVTGSLSQLLSPSTLQAAKGETGVVNLSGADKVTGELLSAFFSNSGGGGGGGGSSGGGCACACAGCACACACAGGGR